MKTYKEKLEEVKQLNEGDIFYDDCGESYVFISATKKILNVMYVTLTTILKAFQ